MNVNSHKISKSNENRNIDISVTCSFENKTSNLVQERTPVLLSCNIYASIGTISIREPEVHMLKEKRDNLHQQRVKNNPTTGWFPTVVTPFPGDRHMRRTTYEVYESASTIAYRIFDCNRVRSIEAVYNNERAIAICTASHNTIFRVRLFKGKSSGSILVEVQKLSGCSLIFNVEYRAILQSTKYNEIPVSEQPQHYTTALTGMYGNTYIPLDDSILEETIYTAQSDLLSDRQDAYLLALEDIASTTNPQQSSNSIAFKASKMIVERCSGILESITKVLSCKYEDTAERKYVRYLSLTILNNVILSLSKDCFIKDAKYDESWMKLLVNEIKHAAIHPRNAALAAKCINVLVANSKEARCQIDRDSMVALQDAKQIGELSYASLEKQALSAINVIEVCAY